MENNTVILKPGESVYSDEEIKELFELVQRFKDEKAKNAILINASLAFIDKIKQLFPNGLTMAGLNLPNIMNALQGDNSLKTDFEKLEKLIEDYKGSNLTVRR